MRKLFLFWGIVLLALCVNAETMTDYASAEVYSKSTKGLGENEPDMMWMTTMNPETRRLIKVTPSEAAATAEIFEVLMGDNLPARKEFISEKGYMYIEDADVS